MTSASKQNWKMSSLKVFILLALPLFLPQPAAAQIRAVVPSSAPAPIGPYTPGVDAADYLYVSGQGARTPNGTMPTSFEEQVRQTLENVKAVVEADGLTLEHIVYTHVYLEDIGKFEEMNRIYQEYFPKSPPARATLGVAKLPGTPVEINAVAVRNLTYKKVISVPGYDSREPVSPGILTHDRLFISAMRGRELSTGKIPEDPLAQVELALDGVKGVVESAGLNLSHVVFVNPYLTSQIPMQVMNQSYAKRFEFGNTPARATIKVAALPEGAQIEFTGVAVRELKQRLAVRPKNMPPSPTASPCVFAGDTLYCSAKSGFIPGPNGGVFATSVENQLRQTMRNLLDNLEEAGLDFSRVVATNVYLDDIGEFQAMNGIYAKYFAKLPPARTTVQPHASVERKTNEEGQSPSLEEISIIAIKPEGK
jgi:2-iminobutanoate/2-iminopropanoate deaminase